MIAYRKIFFTNLAKDNKYQTQLAKGNFSSTARKISKYINNKGKQVLRDKKIGEMGPLPEKVKEQYKMNFESIINSLMTSPRKNIHNKALQDEVVIKITKSCPSPEEKCDLHIKEDKNKSSFTSEDSSEDFNDKAAKFQYRMDTTKHLGFLPILLKKNSILAFEDYSDAEDVIDDSEAFEKEEYSNDKLKP